MAVSSIYAPSKQAGNGVTLAFQFNWKIVAKSDLAVYKISATGVQSALLVLDVDYTVAFDPILENGTVTYTVAPVTLGYALIYRVSNAQQGTVYPRDNALPAKSTEAALDKLTMLLQEAQANVNLPATPIELSGLYAARPAAPVLAVYYYSTDRGSYEKWVPTAGRWFLLG